MYLQQGDVVLKQVESIPENAVKVKASNRGYVLAEGEATGHAHTIDDVAGVEFVEKDGMFYLVNNMPVKIKHQEHKVIEVPAGKWKIDKVREYSHFDEEAKPVKD